MRNIRRPQCRTILVLYRRNEKQAPQRCARVRRTRLCYPSSPMSSPKVDVMNRSDLERVAQAMVAKDKGLLAADESTGTIKKRFDKIKLENTEENRRAYRDMLFTTPGMAQWISGVILYDETIRQKTSAGVPFPEYLAKNGIIPGIKV